MAYDQNLADRIARTLKKQSVTFEEKKMMGGLCFMVDDKMLCGTLQNALMCRVGKDAYEACLSEDGVEIMDFTGKPLTGFVKVTPEAIDDDKALDYWIQKCLDFNPLAKSSKRKKK